MTIRNEDACDVCGVREWLTTDEAGGESWHVCEVCAEEADACEACRLDPATVERAERGTVWRLCAVCVAAWDAPSVRDLQRADAANGGGWL